MTDFGIISDIRERSQSAALKEAKTFVGTFPYMSPERIGGQKYSFACDIWSMALALLTCRVGEFAIRHDSHWELVNLIQSGPGILAPYRSDQVSPKLRDLLQHCFAVEPTERPTAAECLRHPFFAQYRRKSSNGMIPRPDEFPPAEAASEKDAAAASGDSSSKSSKKAADVAQKNERHMLEQVCQLIVQRGMTLPRATVAPSGSPNPLASPTAGGEPPQPLPMEPAKLEGFVNRLVVKLKCNPDTTRAILQAAHNQFVGYSP